MSIAWLEGNNQNILNMRKFKLPNDLSYNTGLILNPNLYFSESACESWLCLTGEEFANMENGLSFEQIQAIAPLSSNVISDPPMALSIEIAKQQIKALDSLPRPTLISCRMGPRSSAAAYMYAGLKSDSDVEQVIEAAELDNAPFTKSVELIDWVRSSIETIRSEDKQDD